MQAMAAWDRIIEEALAAWDRTKEAAVAAWDTMMEEEACLASMGLEQVGVSCSCLFSQSRLRKLRPGETQTDIYSFKS